jgi:chorismate synthase
MGNSFGKIFRLTSYGESHGPSIGGILEGCPAGLKLDFDKIQTDLHRRRPGQSAITTSRNEGDEVEFQSGIMDGITTGTPIGFLIRNTNQRSQDYSTIKDVFRPSHADYTYQEKYGIRDYRGGGRSSARETAVRVVAGAIAKQILQIYGIEIAAYVKSIGEVTMPSGVSFSKISEAENSVVRCPDAATASQMVETIEEAREKKDSLGGVIVGVIHGVTTGLGEPVFDKFHAVLGHAMLSINAVKGFEIGSGFSGTKMKGSEHNDLFHIKEGHIRTQSNNSGGVQGGITNGEDIVFQVAFKPVASISQGQTTVNEQKEEVSISVTGRHDPCVVPRAVPIVEAMAALTTVDMLLRSRLNRINQLV